MTDAAPPWLITARVLEGTLEAPGSADNPAILLWGDAVARKFPDMESYTKLYTHDSIAWCGWFLGYCFASAGIRPPFGPADTDKFMWAAAWRTWGLPTTSPRLGDVLCLDGHVTFYNGEDGDHYIGLGGNQSDSVKQSRYAKSSILTIRRPPPPETQTGTSPMNSGRGSWFSQYQGKYSWVDTGDAPNSNALGVPDDQQGIAFYDRSTLGKWFDVTAPNGVTLRLRQTDIGPSPRTGRLIDIAAAAAEHFGYSPSNFPTDGVFSWALAGSAPAVAPPVVVAPPVILPPVIQEPPVATSDLDRVLDFISRNVEDFKLAIRVLGLARGEPVGSVSVLPPVTVQALPKTEPAATPTMATTNTTPISQRTSVQIGAGGTLAGAVAAGMGAGTAATGLPPELINTLMTAVPAIIGIVGGLPGGWPGLVAGLLNRK